MTQPPPWNPAGPAPGWYPDAHDPRFFRWWDGRAWSGVPHYGLPRQARKPNPFAMVGFIAAAAALPLSVIPNAGYVLTGTAIVFCIVGLVTHKPVHSTASRVLAIIGLCTGIFYAFMVALLLYANANFH
ncbi:DUF2510 domain-containing protein [Arthrobacter silviterrae]|uniref:DUF2510 domain-containing protein n=2 Tax=Arthrobacter silviterrae TaxID=2026658 RepID=A0ABX0D8Y1_9MICC|nr:DUF2510 domain-containing protein [Arthrobacter silviterrae]